MSERHDHAGRYGFDRFMLDAGRGTLQGPEGEIRLRPKSYELLLYLVRNHGRLVGREELLNAVWGHAAVTDDSLTQCLVEIRRALGKDARQLVRTLPRRGYLLDVAVTLLDDKPREPVSDGLPAMAPQREAHSSSLPGRRWPMPVALMACTAFALVFAWWTFGQRDAREPDSRDVEVRAAPSSIAVLPFVDMSAERDQEYFGDGIAEEILNLLAQVKDLKVIARTSSFSFKGRTADIRTIAQQLGVAHVLEGSVRKSGNRVRITAQLVDTADSAHLWSQTYDRELDDIFKVQTEIASRVAEVLTATLLAGRPVAPSDVRAYEHFLRGRVLFHRRGPGDVDRARQHFETAVELDPGYAAAWTALAGTYVVQLGEGDMRPEFGLTPAIHAVERALALDPESAEAHMRAAAVRFVAGDEAGAWRHAHIAEGLDPENHLVLGMQAGGALMRGDLATAIELQGRVVARDPLSALNRMNFGHTLLNAGHFEEARREFLAVRELHPDRADNADLQLAQVLVLEGRHGEGLEWLQRLPEGDERDGVLAIALHAAGRQAEAETAIRRLGSRTSTLAAIRLAEVYAHRGEPDAAWTWLEESRLRIQQESAFADSRWPQLTRNSPYLRPLHDDPRWQALYDAGE
jgi:TolB-like protein/DNA-binding winged helix-turn-helix (wHTH) protein